MPREDGGPDDETALAALPFFHIYGMQVLMNLVLSMGATVVTMGLLSLPTMLKRGYDPAISTGVICASGTLGQIIPPSIVLVLLALLFFCWGLWGRRQR